MSERKAQLQEGKNGLVLISQYGGRFELVSSEEELGEGGYGAYLFVKSERSFDTLTRDNSPNIYKELSEIKNKIQFAHVENDSEKQKKREEHAARLRNLFAGITPVIFTELIPNQYCGQACCWTRPWAIVTTPIGHIEIGWRKSVMHIGWTRTTVPGSGEAIFPNEDVTRSGDYDKERYIHAWGEEKAKQYLAKLHEPATLNIKTVK